MRISLAKHGGLAAGMLLGCPPRVLDTSTLPPAAADELARLVEVVSATPEATELGSRQARDAMSYTITVEDSGHRTVLKRSDTDMSPAFGKLLASLERHLT
jgi:hypothetical protein